LKENDSIKTVSSIPSDRARKEEKGARVPLSDLKIQKSVSFKPKKTVGCEKKGAPRGKGEEIGLRFKAGDAV